MIIVLALGSNIGNRSNNISNALKQLKEKLNISITSSNIYESRPYGSVEQQNFYNIVCEFEIDTQLNPYDLLKICKSIESEMGRVKTQHWGPRLIDIDIIFMDFMALETTELTIPHPEYQNRCFVLEPFQTLPSYQKFKNYFKINNDYEKLCWPVNA